MEFHMEILHPYNLLFGFSYKAGQASVKDQEVTFHEFGIGLIIVNFYFTFY